MAQILSDKQIKEVIGEVIVDGNENLLNPNSIELRLGKYIYFHSSDEERILDEGNFVQIMPGETMTFSSYETIDFRKETVNNFFKNSSLMAFITPTTTMMREGISQVSTKIDPGFHGVLNWSLRNGSSKDLILGYKESVFKLTIFRLSGEENPEKLYGEREQDSYQNTDRIRHSTRKIPATITKEKLVRSNFHKIDPKKQLREAGHPFNYIGTELTQLHGKFETVSKDVILIHDKIKETEKNILEKSEDFFNQQFLKVGGVVGGGLLSMYGGIKIIQNTVDSKTIGTITLIVGVIVIVIVLLLELKNRKQP